MTAPLGVILAGGKSTRMGRDKAFALFAGAPMIAHAFARLAPQAARIAISANGDPGRFAAFNAPVLPDIHANHPGPLAGIHAGLIFARENGFDTVLTIPCDAPFAPRDLAARLPGAGAAVAVGPNGAEPLFALWPVAAVAAVEAALASGGASVWRLLEKLGAREIPIPLADGEDWTLNLNSPAELAAAEQHPS